MDTHPKSPLTRLMPLRCSLAQILAAVALIVGCGEDSSRDPVPPRNLLLITIDTLRADHIGSYGGPSVLSPNIDALAQAGLRFDRTYATAPLTGPSHASILTGRYPSEHGVLYNGMRLAEPMLYSPASTPISAHLQALGFQTGAVVTALPLIRKYGFASGFDSHEFVATRTPTAKADIGGSSADAVAAARQWITEQGAQRFFLWVHLYEVHVPYISPPEIHARLGTKPISIGVPHLGVRPLQEVHSAYRAEVLEMDDAVGSMMAMLDELDHRSSTLVSLVSDHGEYLGEHGGLFGHSLLQEEVMRIPMVLNGPGVTPGVHTGAVSAVDLAPTVLDIMGLPALPGATGRSLAAVERNSEVPIYGEWRDIRLHDPSQQAQSRDLLVGVWYGQRKLVRSDLSAELTSLLGQFGNLNEGAEGMGQRKLARSDLSAELRAYDLSIENGGDRDVYAENPAWLADMTSKLNQFVVAETPVSSEPVHMNVNGLQLLQTLGYIE